jgi:D-alanyl-D-alanine dipeptidase
MELGVALASIQPLVPSIDGDDDVHHLQAHVGVQPGMIEHDRVEADVDDRRRPAPDILSDAQVYTDHSKRRGDIFEQVHGGVRVGRRGSSFNVARSFALIFLLGACFLHRKPPAPVNTPELPTVSDSAADSLLVDVQRVDSSIIVELRYATTNNFTHERLPGYEGNHAYLRDEVAVALSLANADLHRDGFAIKIFDAYRPVRASEAMVAWAQRTNRNDLLRDGYIAARSRHNLGVAVDVTLVDLKTGNELPMGTPFDTFSTAAHTANARGGFAANRKRLKTALERHGFENYEKEWWHFSYDVENPVRFDRIIH